MSAIAPRISACVVSFLACAVMMGGQTPPYVVVLTDYLQSAPLTDAAIHPAAYPAIEFTVNQPGAPAVVWPRGGSRQVRVRFQNPMGAHSATLTVSSGTYTTALGSNNLGVSASPTVLNFPAGGEAESTLTITGLPNYVAKGSLTIPFTLIGATGLSGSLGQTVYLTEASPIGIQNPVWTNVLDDACAWALGQTGQMNCRVTTTFGLFNGYFEYDAAVYHYVVQLPPTSALVFNQKYRLKAFFYDRQSSFPVKVDCQDVSQLLSYCLAGPWHRIECT
ncbi:MAG: hypothetical protein H0W86_06500 [Armatimonadetes bacterium]|nr:hypothetical protein [Armatimonadota bacterium]